MPTALPPYRAQLATLVEEAPRGSQWLHELKYDGYRMGCSIDGGRVKLESRRDRDWTAAFPELVEAASRLPVERAVLDGEVAVVLPSGVTSFQALQNALAGTSRAGLTYFVFDLLHLNGEDVSALPLEARKERCRALLARLESPSPLRYSEHFDTDGPALLRRACELGAEGIVSKRRDQPYRPGRNDAWLKAKCSKRQELVIGGFTDPAGARSGIGALLVGYFDGDLLRYGGKVGTGRGFTASYLRELRRRLERESRADCPFTPAPPADVRRVAHWVNPVLSGEVAFTEWTQGGHVRHASFQGLREDKAAGEVTRERAAAPEAIEAERRAPAASPKVETPIVRGIAISTPHRPVYPELSFTKLDLAEFYSSAAARMLPYIAGRPLTLVRCEKGVRRADALRSECRFLRHEPGWHRWVEEPIRRVHIQEQKKVGEYLIVDSPEALVALAQGDILEIHVWNSTFERLETPDRIVFDLDPGDAVEWSHVVQAARWLREELAERKLDAWPKLTGGKGIHVVVPFAPELPWDAVYGFSRAVAEALVRRDPGALTLDFTREGRQSKILIDYKRNHRAAVAVAAYSCRARPHGGVSTPVSWRELLPSLRPESFTVKTLPARWSGRRADPWRGFWVCQQQLRV